MEGQQRALLQLLEEEELRALAEETARRRAYIGQEASEAARITEGLRCSTGM